MKKFLQSILGALALFFISSGAFANDYVKFKGWKQAETTHFRFIYEAASEPAAQAYAKLPAFILCLRKRQMFTYSADSTL